MESTESDVIQLPHEFPNEGYAYAYAEGYPTYLNKESPPCLDLLSTRDPQNTMTIQDDNCRPKPHVPSSKVDKLHIHTSQQNEAEIIPSAEYDTHSSGSTSSTEPCDVPNLTNPVQEADHEIANSCSKLAVNDPSESLSLVYQSPHSVSVTASILSGRLSTTLSVIASLPHIREDEQHQNEDATQYPWIT